MKQHDGQGLWPSHILALAVYCSSYLGPDGRRSLRFPGSENRTEQEADEPSPLHLLCRSICETVQRTSQLPQHPASP